MMGTLPSERQQTLWSYRVLSLDRRVPADHLLRQIDAALDLAFVLPAVQGFYGLSGNRSLDPRMILKLMLLLFLYDLPSERELMRQLAVRLDLLWFLGLDLDSEIPDHSVLSKARARWGAEVFEKLFVTSVKQCVEAGLVSGRLLHVDSTMVKANAHGDSVVTSSPELVQALREAYQQQESKLEVLPAATLQSSNPVKLVGEAVGEASSAPVAEAGTRAPVAPSGPAAAGESAPELKVLPAVRLQPAPAPESPAAERAPELQVLPRPAQPVTVVAAGRQGEATPETKPAGQKLPVNITHISTTDPTAELARSKNGLKDLNYKEHRLVDDAHGVITAVATTRANVADGLQLPELYEQHVVTTGMVRAGVTVAGDHHYGTADNYLYCAEQGMRAHLGPYQAHVQERGQLPPSRFVYEAEQDRLRCPEGHYLELHQHRPEQHEKVYEMKHPAVCAGCQLRPICTKSKRGRSIRRHEQAELVQAARAQAHSEAGRYSRRRRQHVMEGTFADAANNHGAKQARWRGLGRQKIQSWIIAAVQNLRRLVRHQAGRGPVGAAVGVGGKSAMVLRKVLGQIPGPVQRRAGSGRWFLPYRYGLSLAQAATAALRAGN